MARRKPSRAGVWTRMTLVKRITCELCKGTGRVPREFVLFGKVLAWARCGPCAGNGERKVPAEKSA